MARRAWCHTNIHRLRKNLPDVISVKVPGERIRYERRIVLTDCLFKVHEGGRQTCLREGVRNVHAWIVGEETHEPVGFDMNDPAWHRALYDPWKGGTFVDSVTLKPVYEAEAVVMIGKVVWYR